jgi:hypothetical protein
MTYEDIISFDVVSKIWNEVVQDAGRVEQAHGLHMACHEVRAFAHNRAGELVRNTDEADEEGDDEKRAQTTNVAYASVSEGMDSTACMHALSRICVACCSFVSRVKGHSSGVARVTPVRSSVIACRALSDHTHKVTL